VATALAEVRRVLRPGGRLLVLDTDWASVVWRCNDAERMRRVLAAWDEHLVDPYLPRRLTGLLEDAGFTVTEVAAVPMLNAGYDPDTFSAGLIGFVSASRITAATKVVSATAPKSRGSGRRSKNPPANPASLLPVAIERNHTPIMAPAIRRGASFVTIERPTGLIHSSPIVCRK